MISQRRLQNIMDIPDEDIDLSDIPEADPQLFQKAISAVQAVRALKVGESFSRAKFIPTDARLTPDLIKLTKRRLLNQLTKIIDRAGEGDYKMHTIHAFTENYDLIVVGIIVRLDELGS